MEEDVYRMSDQQSYGNKAWSRVLVLEGHETQDVARTGLDSAWVCFASIIFADLVFIPTYPFKMIHEGSLSCKFLETLSAEHCMV